MIHLYINLCPSPSPCLKCFVLSLAILYLSFSLSVSVIHYSCEVLINLRCHLHFHPKGADQNSKRPYNFLSFFHPFQFWRPTHGEKLQSLYMYWPTGKTSYVQWKHEQIAGRSWFYFNFYCITDSSSPAQKIIFMAVKLKESLDYCFLKGKTTCLLRMSEKEC